MALLSAASSGGVATGGVWTGAAGGRRGACAAGSATFGCPHWRHFEREPQFASQPQRTHVHSGCRAAAPTMPSTA
eukprot:10813177-Lingulodinium_polyedra.AAC.1